MLAMSVRGTPELLLAALVNRLRGGGALPTVTQALIDVDGRGTCSNGKGVECPRLYSTKGGGIATIAVGALAVAAGVLVLTGKF